MKRLKDELLFDTDIANLIASDGDGIFLYRTEDEVFFLHTKIDDHTGAVSNSIELIEKDKAKDCYDSMSVHVMEFEEAFNEPAISCKDWNDREERCDEDDEP